MQHEARDHVKIDAWTKLCKVWIFGGKIAGLFGLKRMRGQARRPLARTAERRKLWMAQDISGSLSRMASWPRSGLHLNEGHGGARSVERVHDLAVARLGKEAKKTTQKRVFVP